MLTRIKPKLIAITTRARPKLNTFEIPINKRFRGPNKNKTPMEIQIPNKIVRDNSTQTDIDSNKGKGLSSLIPDKHEELFKAIDDTPTPDYRFNLMKVFNEEFIAEISKKDLGPIIDLVEKQDWLSLKKTNPIFYKIHRDLSVTPSGCLLYDNRLVIPAKLRPMVLQTVHSKHPGQAGMLALAKLIWYPHIHSEIVAQAQSCKHCIDKGKNLKPIIARTNLGSLPTLVEPNEEIQMDFAGPIPFKNNTQNNYILVTVDRLSRYPHAEIFNNCDTNTAIEYLESYCKVHGIPRSIRCDQAQAFKAKEFDIFCKNKNIKLILAPAGDHRGTGMVERLIQTIKRRLAVLDIDPNWSNTTLTNRLANIIENIRLIPNTTTKLSPFEAHFGRQPNTEISNITTKASHKNLTYKNLTNYCLDKKVLKQNALTMEEIWRRDGESEQELDIRYQSDNNNEDTQPSTPTNLPTGSHQPVEVTSSDDSEIVPLATTSRTTKSPRKIYPSEIHFTIGDKTTKYIKTRKNIARKSLARKTKEPRNTLAPQWNIIQDGTITNYSPHTITIDTPLRKNTVIRKNQLAIVNEQKPITETTEEQQKPRLIHMVACKTVGEYKRNQEKIKKFCLEEAKQQKVTKANPPTGGHKIQQTNSRNTRQRAQPTNWSPAKVRQVASLNQRKQQQKTKSPTTPKKQNRTKQSDSKKRSRTPKANPGETFKQRSKMMALQSTQEHEQNRTFIQVDTNALQQSPSTITYQFVENESPQTIFASSDPKDFMFTSPDSPPVQHDRNNANNEVTNNNDFKSTKSTPKIDKTVEKIQRLNDNTAKFNNPQIIFLDAENKVQEEHEIATILQQEQARLEKEQANIISILPAPKETVNTETLSKGMREEIPQPTGKGSQPGNNNNNTDQLVTEKNEKTKDTSLKEQPIERTEPKSQKSYNSSTTSQEYCTPPLSPTSEISDINSADIEALNETL